MARKKTNDWLGCTQIFLVSFQYLIAQQIGVIPEILFSQRMFSEIKQRFELCCEGRRYIYSKKKNRHNIDIQNKNKKRQ